ncbi:hypothetical protein [Caldisalinibacter kiritimatiensis]|jgi:hypothetical protein|uniref:DUF4179 domain-containing protein n=1 Tax=Caldisalinibacter kiritimatiensis TaxID=1304284 RepID=R1CCK1_9FIRM|nr:hypothetical protein [Caldisalinibacter kiritimatiensis]EOC99994.1 hypothetical protein L21TH_1966 [Caldisalinibacter kiritimatiensis]
MNNLKDLKDYINENLEDIKMTEDIRNNIIKKSKNNSSYTMKYVAMIVLPILLISCLIFNEPISYATQRVLKYVPGIRKLISTDVGNQVYGLSGSIEMSIGEQYIKVNSAYTESNTVTLIMEGNVPLDILMKDKASLGHQIIALDEYNNVAEITSWDIIGDSDEYQWSGRITYTFKNPVKKFNIVYDKYKMPIIMTELPEVSFKERNYISVNDIGIDIAVITNYVEDKLEVNLLAQANDSDKSISFPLNDIYLVNSKGEKYYCISSNLENKLYFDKKLEPGMKLVIPYILIEDEGLQSKVTISKDDELPIHIKVGENDLVINSVEWIQYVERFNYRTPENDYHLVEEAAQKVKLVINKNMVGSNDLKLYDIAASVNENQLNKYMVEGVKVIFTDPTEENNSEITNENYKELVLTNIKKEQQEIIVTFTDPIFYMTNEIIIPLQP